MKTDLLQLIRENIWKFAT